VTNTSPSTQNGGRNEASRVLLVDQHPLVRAGARALLHGQTDFVVVGEADTDQVASSLAADLRPDLVVIDVSPPGPQMMTKATSIVHAFPRARLLALSAYPELAFAQVLMRVGVAGYALKRARCDEFLEALRVIVRGGTYLDPSLAAAHLRARYRGPAGRSPSDVDLSDRETQVVQMLARGYVSKEIAAGLRISHRTVETYRTRAMTKLRLGSRAELLRFALRSGWLQDG